MKDFIRNIFTIVSMLVIHWFIGYEWIHSTPDELRLNPFFLLEFLVLMLLMAGFMSYESRKPLEGHDSKSSSWITWGDLSKILFALAGSGSILAGLLYGWPQIGLAAID